MGSIAMDSADVDSGEIVLQMGFASFGQQPSNKKRRYNSAADTVSSMSVSTPPTIVQTQRLNGKHQRGQGRDRGQQNKKEKDAGSTQTPMEVRRKPQIPMSGENHGDINKGGNNEGGLVAVSDSGPGITNTQARDSLVNNSIKARAYRHSDDIESGVQKADIVNAEIHARGRSSQQRFQVFIEGRKSDLDEEAEQEQEAPEVQHSDLTMEGPYDWGALRRGVRDARGDVAYYQKSFVEDPWATVIKGPNRK